jgi:hypothetical protein
MPTELGSQTESPVSCLPRAMLITPLPMPSVLPKSGRGGICCRADLIRPGAPNDALLPGCGPRRNQHLSTPAALPHTFSAVLGARSAAAGRCNLGSPRRTQTRTSRGWSTPPRCQQPRRPREDPRGRWRRQGLTRSLVAEACRPDVILAPRARAACLSLQPVSDILRQPYSRPVLPASMRIGGVGAVCCAAPRGEQDCEPCAPEQEVATVARRRRDGWSCRGRSAGLVRLGQGQPKLRGNLEDSPAKKYRAPPVRWRGLKAGHGCWCFPPEALRFLPASMQKPSDTGQWEERAPPGLPKSVFDTPQLEPSRLLQTFRTAMGWPRLRAAAARQSSAEDLPEESQILSPHPTAQKVRPIDYARAWHESGWLSNTFARLVALLSSPNRQLATAVLESLRDREYGKPLARLPAGAVASPHARFAHPPCSLLSTRNSQPPCRNAQACVRSPVHAGSLQAAARAPTACTPMRPHASAG